MVVFGAVTPCGLVSTFQRNILVASTGMKMELACSSKMLVPGCKSIKSHKLEEHYE
jgi:hypothetical protein